MKKWRILRQGVYRFILLSYFAILAVAMVASSLFMRQSEKILLSEILRANQASMERLRQQIDDGLRNIESMCMEYASDSTLTNLVVNQRGTRTRKSYVDAVDVVKALSSSKFNNPYIDHMYLMLFTDQYVLSDAGKYTLEEFYAGHFGGQQSMGFEEMVIAHTQNRYRQYALLPLADGRMQPLFLYALPLSSPSAKSACLGVFINRSMLSQMLSDSEWLPGAHVAIVDQSDQAVELWGGSGEALAQQLDWREVADGQPMERALAGETYYAMAIQSEVTPWRYMSLVPAGSYMQSRAQLVQVFVISFAAMLLAGTGMALYLSHRQYLPLRRLVDLTGPDAAPAKGKNEYHLLERSISNFKSENSMLSRINKTQSEVLRSQYLAHILRGTLVDEYEIDGILRECGMPLRFPRFTVISADACDWEAYKRGQPGNTSLLPDGATYLNFVGEQLERCAPEQLDMVWVAMDRVLYALVNLATPEAAALRPWCQLVHDRCVEQFGFAPSLGVSSARAGSGQIHDAFLEVEAVREYQRITGMGGVRLQQELPETTVDSEITHQLEEQKLVGMLQAGRFGEARALFNQLLEDKFYRSNLSTQAKTCGLYGLISTLMNAFHESDALSRGVRPDGPRPVERLMRCDSVQALKTEMNLLLDELCAQPTKLDETRIDAVALTEEAVALIEQRYADQLLSVALVAEELKVNPVQLTRAFKKTLGVSVLDYIHRSRLHIAKQLLLRTDENITSIAQRTGYNNNVTFIRVFKKYEELTPGQYRAQHSGGQEREN